ncbi:MAG: metal-dependent transcriptional regulator [Bacteroidetes bacterium]|jgi:DtxR family Mn-dependent transcriptional regulator|nr:metal-dependent transcriptional regulator [Bacteroidota bacterium]
MRQETIENYLKTIYNLSSNNTAVVNNQKIADRLSLNPATVTEGLRKLHELKYIVYEKSYGSRLTTSGSKLALDIIRRHRIWETYLAKELGFGWDEVHAIAEELEHVNNVKLINKLASILGNPIYDPHGDPIPDEKGKIQKSNFIKLSETKLKLNYKVMGVTDHSTTFLKYLEKHNLIIGANINVKTIEDFDNSIVLICQKKEVNISPKAADCIIVQSI